MCAPDMLSREKPLLIASLLC
jgi:hypothetical protein